MKKLNVELLEFNNIVERNKKVFSLRIVEGKEVVFLDIMKRAEDEVMAVNFSTRLKEISTDYDLEADSIKASLSDLINSLEAKIKILNKLKSYDFSIGEL